MLDVEFEAEHLPELYNALEINGTTPTAAAQIKRRRSKCSSTSAAIRCARSRCRSTDGVVRGMEVVDTGGADHGAGRRSRRSAASSTCSASRSTTAPPIPKDALRWPIHRKRPDFVEPRAEDGDLRDGHQGHRSHRAVREGRKDRSLRRRRRRQDGRHSGADQQRREGPRRQVGVLRRGRAHARRQRSLSRVQGSGHPRLRSRSSTVR